MTAAIAESHVAPHERRSITTGPLSKTPWRVVKSRRQGWAYEVRDAFRDPIAVVYTTQADAWQIAAASDLCEAAKGALRVLTSSLDAPDRDETIARLYAALKKAQGGEP